MKTTFDELFADISALEKKLSAPVEFHAAKSESYHRTATAIARRVLMGARPPEHNADSWSHKVDKTLDRISLDLMLGGGTTLSISSPPESSGSLDPKESRPPTQQVNHKDIVEWIRSGVAGEEGGKRITAEDRKILDDPKQGENALATIVMRAYYSRHNPPNYTRLRRVIQRYLTGEESASEPLLDAVAAAWEVHFSVRFSRDLTHHFSRLAREF